MLRIATGDSGLNIDNFMTDYVIERRGIGGGTRFMHGELVNSCDPRDLNVYRVYDLSLQCTRNFQLTFSSCEPLCKTYV